MSMKYLAGRTFDVGTDSVEPGDELTEEQVAAIPYLDSFISSGYIYVVTPAKGYDQLPPHVFTAVQTRLEAEQAIHAGEEVVTVSEAEKAQKAVDTDEQSKLAERQDKQDLAFAKFRNRRGKITQAEKESSVSIEDGKTEYKLVKGDPAPGFIEHDDGLAHRAPAAETKELLEEHSKETTDKNDLVTSSDKSGGSDDPNSLDNDKDGDATNPVNDTTIGGEGDENQVNSDKGEFDPSAHTVDEVKTYIDENPDDKDRVLKAEKSGKNRSSLSED